MKYYPLKKGEKTTIRILFPDKETTLNIGYDTFPRKKFFKTPMKGNSCHICNAERINSRFEILDL